MAIVTFAPPLEWEDETYTEVDTDLLARLKGRDKLAIMARLRKRGERDVMQAETDDRYVIAALSRATKIPEDAFGELPIRVFTEVVMEAQSSLLSSEDGADPPSSN